MISGKFSQQRPITGRIEKSLQGVTDPSLKQVSDACISAFEAENKRLAEESILSKYDMTVEDFVKSRQLLGDSLYESLWKEIGRIKIGCDLLVCGFDGNYEGHIFIVSNPTDENPSFITHCDDPGFGVIGSGAYLAESTLYAFEAVWTNRLAIVVYQCIIAKYIAESASDVGQTTFLQVFDMYGNDFDLPNLEEWIRKQWLKTGKPRIPRTALEKISNAISKAKKSMPKVENAEKAMQSDSQTSEDQQ